MVTLPTVSNPTWKNSFASTFEPYKPFDDTTQFWHTTRTALIQCSLYGAALSFYIRSYDTYKQDWPAFVQAIKKQFSSQKNAYYAQVDARNLVKRTIKQFVTLSLEFNQQIVGVMRTH